MKLIKTLMAALFLFQAAGASELFCAEAEDHAAEAASEQHQQDAACQWHCGACAMAADSVPLAVALPAPGLRARIELQPPSFVPPAPSANIFHPPA